MKQDKEQKKLSIERLKNNRMAEVYFNTALDDCKNLPQKEGEQHLIAAFKNIALSNGRVGKWIISTYLGEKLITYLVKLMYKFKIR